MSCVLLFAVYDLHRCVCTVLCVPEKNYATVVLDRWELSVNSQELIRYSVVGYVLVFEKLKFL
jgi:hypothetical protein